MIEKRKIPSFFQSQKNISLSQYSSFQNFTEKGFQQDVEERKIIEFSPEKQKEKIQKLQWRKKTEFPIVKILSYAQLNSPSFTLQKYLSKKVLIQLIVQPILYTLCEVDDVPIFKVFYIFKQTLIGVERLCSLYGNFIVKSNMVAIDQKKKCKVWHNSKFHINKPEIPCLSEEETVRSVIQLFSSITKTSVKSIRFYKDLQKCRTFCDCLIVLKNFTTISLTRIPSFFMLVDKFSSNLCSPRKYISRPPSTEQNPESPQTVTSRHKSPNFKGHWQKSEKFRNFAIKRAKVQSFVGMSNRQQKNQTFLKFVPATTLHKINKNVVTNQFKKYFYKIDQKESISPKSVDKADMLFSAMKNEKNWGVIESAFEGDSDSTSIQETLQQPQIRLFEPKVKEYRESQLQNYTVLNRSQISLERSLTEMDLCQNMIKTDDHLTKNERIQPAKRDDMDKFFYPFMKFIDKSFDESPNLHS